MDGIVMESKMVMCVAFSASCGMRLWVSATSSDGQS